VSLIVARLEQPNSSGVVVVCTENDRSRGLIGSKPRSSLANAFFFFGVPMSWGSAGGLRSRSRKRPGGYVSRASRLARAIAENTTTYPMISHIV
jgi:hypothetical protein